MGSKDQPGRRRHGRAQSDNTHIVQSVNASQTSFAQRAAAGRFLEGSMNDRVSAVPPATFLGPEEAAAYEKQFYKPGADAALAPATSHVNRHSVQSSVSAAPSDASKRSFFAPLWDGVRATLGRARSSSTIRDNSQRNSSSSAGSMDDATIPQKKPAAEAGRMTREEVMASYQNLVDSGFFSSHAIQSTRHAFPAPAVPPPQHAPPPVPTAKIVTSTDAPASPRRPAPPAPVHAPPAPPSTTPMSPNFSLFPRPPNAANTPTIIPRQTRHTAPPVSFKPLPTIPSVPANLTSPDRSAPSSPARGTKRARSSADDDTAGPDTASGARKVLKKLRKSTSKFGADLRSSKTNASLAAPPFATTPATETSDVEMGGMNRLRRSFSSSLRPDTKPKTPSTDARPRSSAGKLLKRGRKAGNTNSDGTSAQGAGQLSSPQNQPAYPETFLSPPSNVTSPRASYESSASSAMSPTTAAAFHYPSRTRARRVSVDGKETGRALRTVAPDANRGVPEVPAIPAGMFKFGIGAEENEENLRRRWAAR